jgi:HlyD family secretion protein
MSDSTKKSRKVVVTIVSIVLLSAVVGGGIYYFKNRKPSYNTFEVKKQNLKEIIEISGSVESEYNVTIKSSVSGTVIKRFIPENKRVEASSLLLQVEAQQSKLQLEQSKINAFNSRLQAETELGNAQRALSDAKQRKKLNTDNLRNQINKAKSNVSFIEQEIKRNEKLLLDGAITKQTLDNQKQQFEQAKIDLKTAIDNMEKLSREEGEIVTASSRIKQAEIGLENAIRQGNASVSISKDSVQRTTMYTPFSGTITSWLINVGDYLVPSTPIAKFQDLEDIRLKLPINELDLPKINFNSEISLVFDSYPDRKYKGKITWMSEASVSDAQNVQTFPVKVKFDNKDKLIKPGMSGDAEITVSEKKNVLAVPLGAISKKENKIYVNVLEKDKVKEVEIKPGISTIEYLEVTSGIKEGDKIVVEQKS